MSRRKSRAEIKNLLCHGGVDRGGCDVEPVRFFHVIYDVEPVDVLYAWCQKCEPVLTPQRPENWPSGIMESRSISREEFLSIRLIREVLLS